MYNKTNSNWRRRSSLKIFCPQGVWNILRISGKK